MCVPYCRGASLKISENCLDPGAGGPETFVSWDHVASRCDPPVCNGTRLSDIPFASGTLPIELAHKLKLYDALAARTALAGKCVVLLGDSTMQETAHDIIILLSGIAGNPALLHSYLHQATRQNSFSKVCIPFYPANQTDLSFVAMGQAMPPCNDGVDVYFHGSHRNMTAHIYSTRTVLRTRFTGHHILSNNMGGINTFFAPQFQVELDELLVRGCDGKPTDILIINTGHHDRVLHEHRDGWSTDRKEFTELLIRLGDRLEKLVNRGIRVMWKGNYGSLAALDPWRDIVAKLIMTHRRSPLLSAPAWLLTCWLTLTTHALLTTTFILEQLPIITMRLETFW